MIVPRTYSLGQAATELFDEAFDEHTAQEREHLVDLGSSRFHSKAKTKHLRHALAVHILEEGRKQHEGEAWCTVLGSESLRFGKLLSDFMDTVDRKVGQFVAEQIAPAIPAALQPSGSTNPPQRSRVRDVYAAILKASQNHFVDVVETSSLQAALGMMSAILGSRTPWSESSVLLKDSSIKRALQDVAPRDHGQAFCLTLRLLALCHLVAAGLGSNPHGTPTVFYIRRSLVAENPAYVHYVNILTQLQAGFGLNFSV